MYNYIKIRFYIYIYYRDILVKRFMCSTVFNINILSFVCMSNICRPGLCRRQLLGQLVLQLTDVPELLSLR